MDFTSLAEATSMRRILESIIGKEGIRSDLSHQGLYQTASRSLSSTEDDDFSHLDTSVSTSSHYQQNDSIVDFTKSLIDEDMSDETVSQPFLSPAAEGELFMLATNFLLYVAMVLIITMVAKIYFPEALERTQEPTAEPVTRTVNYRRVSEDEKEKSGDKGSFYSSDEEDGNPNNEMEELLELEDDFTTTTNMKTKSRRPTTDADDGDVPDLNKSPSLLDELEFEQEKSSRTQVLKRLAFCIFMLNVTFVTWGLLQERMLTRRYPRFTGEYFTYSYALVFTNRFWTLIMSGMLMLHLKPKRSGSTLIYEYSFPSISNMLSSWCQYEALRYVSFPAVTLFKSFKLAPVMAMGKFLGNKQYPQYDYYVALMIGIGITMFMTSTDDLNVGFGYNIYDQKGSAVWTGIMLLGLFLFFDSFTSQWQSRMFQRHRDLSMVEMMFATSAFSSLLSFITLIHSKELWPAMDFVYRHSEIHIHFFLFSICSTIGQLLIFYTIKNFGAVIFTIIMTTRVVLSISLSCFLYGHNITSFGIFGLLLVMTAVGYRIKRKAEGSQLIKWRGMDDDKAKELVHEWHEHTDM